MSNLGYAGRVVLNEIVLVKPIDQTKHDLKMFNAEVNLDSSIIDASMTCKVLISDGQNILRKMAIEIGDIIEITFTQYDEQRTLRFRVFKLGNFQDYTKERAYEITCHSELFYVSQYIHISRAYSGTFSDIAQTIFKEHTFEEFSIWEQTALNRHFICPQWSPMKAIDWLAKNSKSSTANNRMRFFQNSLGKYCFTSIEKMNEVSQEPVMEYVYNISTFFKNGATNTENELKKIESIEYNTAFDFQEKTKIGAFSGERNQVDLTRKTMDIVTYNYWRDTDTSKLMNKQLLNSPLWVDHSKSSTYAVASYAQNGIEKNFINDVSCLKSSLGNSHSVTINVKGNNIVDVGNIVHLEIPSPEPQSSDGRDTTDPFWSGRYMVAAKRDMFRSENHAMSLVLIKDSF